MASEENLPLPPELQSLSAFVDNRAECLAGANDDLRTIALCAAKFMFDWALQTETASKPHLDTLLASLTDAAPPQTRSQTRSSAKRKRSPSPVQKPQKKFSVQETPLPSLFVDGMSSDQIWLQLDLRAARVCEYLQVLDGEDEEGDSQGEDSDASEGEEDDEDEGEVEELEVDDEDRKGGSSYTEGDDDSIAGDEGVIDLREGTSEEEDDDDDDEDHDGPPTSMLDVVRGTPRANALKSESRWQGQSGLDDGFFDLAAFNAETEEAEAQSVSKGRLSFDADEDEDSEEDDSDIDYFGPVEDAEVFDEDDPEFQGEEPFYKDFFDAPRLTGMQKKVSAPTKSSKVRFHDQVKVKKIKPVGKGMPLSFMEDSHGDEDEEDEDGIEAEVMSTMERFKDDLFGAEDDEETPTDMTNHERRLEAENVAKKDWVLMGEASSKARPNDSLLQEDLEFERAMKAVPVVTEEVILGLEARIKARITEGRFDDVVRRRPVDDKPFLPSRFFELQDTKSTQSLAQIYEGEYIAAQAGTSGNDQDGKLKKEHEEITKLWDGICNKLDALSSISTVSDLPAASLESALPVGKSAASMLAPEEVYAPASSDVRARSELTPAEKRILRAKERKARKKTRDVLQKSVKGGMKKQKEAALRSVIKSGRGVTVVGKQNKKEKAKS
ncbi:Mpp10 protein [Melanogaster broomeanus]|nr:Mpp10 protein [Melanogaster broomeanus]